MSGFNLSNLSPDQLKQLQTVLTPKMTKYIPITPTAKQTAALLMNPVREMLYGGAAGGGKDLALDTPILTANRGWQSMGSIIVGDQVFGSNGVPCNVVAKSPVFTDHACYRLVFDTGEAIVAGGDHLWEINKWNGRNTQRIVTTKQIYDYYQTHTRTLAILKGGYLEYPNAVLPCHPYAFGVWLGDGSKHHGHLASTDDQIYDNLEGLGYDIYTTQDETGEWKSMRLRAELRDMGFAIQTAPREKRIPREYLEASAVQRLLLLRGLMDTDGNASSDRGYCSICMVNKPLMQDIEELVRSLGIKVTLRESVATCTQTGAKTPKYNLKWSTELAMFTLRYKDLLQNKGPFRGTQDYFYIRRIEEVPTVATQCIQVDSPDHLYLVGRSLIPTHNSVFLLAAALQYVDTPGYSAILFRKTFSDLMLPGALIPMSQEWLGPFIRSGEVKWQDKEKRYTFLETGATLSFGYLDSKNDELRYQGAEFQFVGMDEVTHIDPVAYRYLFSRMRRLKGSNIPIRMRATANPGGPHGEYYYQRFFVDDEAKSGKRIFLPAGLRDNPHLDIEEYRESLSELDEVTRKQLEDGDWEIRPRGDLFDKSWILSIDYRGIPEHTRWVRFWDLASIDPKYRRKTTNTKAPDYTVGFKMGMADGCYYIGDIIRVQMKPGDVEELIRNTAEADGLSCAIRMEEEGGASGIANTERYARVVLQGFDYAGVRPVVSKIERARPFAAACQTGSVFLSNRCRGIVDFYAQLEAFPNGVNDDIVDAASGAFAYFKPSMGRVVPPPANLNERVERRKRVEEQIRRAGGYYGSYWRMPMSNR